MSKLKLNIEDLKVESFVTASDNVDAKGTVNGQEAVTGHEGCWTYASCNWGCQPTWDACYTEADYHGNQWTCSQACINMSLNINHCGTTV